MNELLISYHSGEWAGKSEVRVPALYGWDWRQTVGFCCVPIWQHSLLAPSMTLNLYSLLSSQRLTSRIVLDFNLGMLG